MPFDQHKNLAIATVTTATGAAGTTLGVGAGEGARFPAVPFNATVWPFDMAPDPTTAEVVRVTARTTDTLTIVRAQEGTTARAIIVGDMVAATITAKSLTDIESGVNFPLIAFAPPTGLVHMTTADGADTGLLSLTGGGAVAATRGAYVHLYGNEGAGGGALVLAAGGSSGAVTDFYTAGTLRGRIHPSGGFSWGGTTDPGAGNFTLGPGCPPGPAQHTALTLNQTSALGGATLSLRRDGVEVGALITGAAQWGTAFTHTVLKSTTADGLDILNTHAAGKIRFVTGVANDERGRIHPSGGLSWGTTTDPGINNLLVLGTVSAAGHPITSDARLKTPLNRHTDTEVLRNTVIHNFIWKSDGTAGRGVFAQEAHLVAPFAVSVGSDEVDDQGRLTHPWGVDYSKYVPDLITGWQIHDALLSEIVNDDLEEMAARVAFLEGAITAMREPHSPAADWFNRLRTAIRSLWNVWKPSWV